MSDLQIYRLLVMQDDQQNVHDALRDAVIAAREANISKGDILYDLGLLRSEVDEATEDAILEVMDYLAGWCSHHMKID